MDNSKEELKISIEEVRNRLCIRDTGNATPNETKQEVPPTRRLYKVSFGRIVAVGAAVAICFSLAVNTTAVRERSFLDIVESGPNGTRIIVTGNEGNPNGTMTSYGSWDDLPAGLLKPSYIPGTPAIDDLYGYTCDPYTLYACSYNGGLYIKILQPHGGYPAGTLFGKCTVISINGGTAFMGRGDSYMGVWLHGQCLYIVEYPTLPELQEIVRGMQNHSVPEA